MTKGEKGRRSRAAAIRREAKINTKTYGRTWLLMVHDTKTATPSKGTPRIVWYVKWISSIIVLAMITTAMNYIHIICFYSFLVVLVGCGFLSSGMIVH